MTPHSHQMEVLAALPNAKRRFSYYKEFLNKELKDYSITIT